MHILLRVHFFDLFVFHLQVDVVIPLLLNASLLLVLTTDYDVFLWVLSPESNYLSVEDRETFDFGMFVFTVGTTALHNF